MSPTPPPLRRIASTTTRVSLVVLARKGSSKRTQHLDAWARPDVLAALARKCAPAVRVDRAMLSRPRAAKVPNAALCIKHYVPACSEVERLRLIGASLDHADEAHRVCDTEPELLAAWPAAEAAMNSPPPLHLPLRSR